MTSTNLVSVSKPTAYTGVDSAQDLVAWAARVSNPSNQTNTQTASRLVKFLIKKDHWSPLEMVHIVIEIKSTRDIVRQILRHRSFSFQEFSQRYADPTKDLGFELREARLQDQKNRQNSVEVSDTLLKKMWNSTQQSVITAAKNAYALAIENGIAKEQARAVLPEGNTESVVIMAGTLRSWVHYCMLRTANGTQKEHMEVAKQCWDIISAEFPDIRAAVDEINKEKELKDQVYQVVFDLFNDEEMNRDDLSGYLIDDLEQLMLSEAE